MMCPHCKGKRMIVIDQHEIVGGGFIPEYDICPTCKGKGFLDDLKEEGEEPKISGGIESMRYTVDCFTERWAGTEFPENTYDCDSVEHVAEIVNDCTKEIAGIKKIEVWINEPYPEE